MSSVAAGKRSWKCPECGSEEQLSVTQLDPMACEACLEKMRGGRVSANAESHTAPTGPMGIWHSLPDMTKLAVVAIAFIAGLLLGLTLGYFAGRSAAPIQNTPRTDASRQPAPVIVEKAEERPAPPGPGYKWVRGRERKDGTRGPGYWAKDPHYKGGGDPESNKRK